MGNFGRLGSAMVRDAIAFDSHLTRKEDWENSKNQRDLKEKQAGDALGVRQAEVDEVGGERAYQKMLAKEEMAKREHNKRMMDLKQETEKARATKFNAQALGAIMKKSAATGNSSGGGQPVEVPAKDFRTGKTAPVKISANQKAFGEAIGAEFIANNGEVAMKMPWGAGYTPKKMADMNTQQRDEAKAMLARWDEDPGMVKTEAPNGSTIYTHKDSGFSVNSDGFMLTANSEGKYEVASMFDIGMMTGQVSQGKVDMDIQKAMNGQTVATAETAQTGQEGPKPTAEEMNTAQTMLAVDESGATPSAGGKVPGQATAQAGGAPVSGSMPRDEITIGDQKFSKDEYDLPGLKGFLEKNAEGLLAKGLAQKGLKPGTPEYEKAFNEQLPKLATWAANKQFKKGATQGTQIGPRPIEETMAGPEQKPKDSMPVHWSQSKPDLYKGYEPKYQAKEGYSNNYGNYKSQDDYYAARENTIKALRAGKDSADSDKLLKRFASDWEKFYNLGIATEADLKRYDADMSDYDAKRKAQHSAAMQKMGIDEKNAKIISEAAAPIDKAVDEGIPALEAVNLTPSQMRKVTRAQGNNKLDTDTKKSFQGIKNRSRHLKHLQEAIDNTDLQSLETVSPMKRAEAWVNRYFGNMSKKERADMIAQQGMTELVSRTIKEISGAAASDQERAYIQGWMLGKEGYSAKTVTAIVKNIEYKLYDEAKGLGDTLYRGSHFGALQELQTSTKQFKDITFVEDVLGGTNVPKGKEIKRVRTHGNRGGR